MADALAHGKIYHMFQEEPEHCAVSLLSVLESLWKLRTKTGWPDAAEAKRQGRVLSKAMDRAFKRVANKRSAEPS